MAATAFDSALFADMFGTPEMRAVFDDRSLVGKYLRVEVALARAEASLGLIPQEAADALAAHASVDAIDWAKLKRDTDRVGYPILPLVSQIAAKVPRGLGEFAHWGATTQDIMDTATALQLGEALDLIDGELAAIEAALRTLAANHRDTAMVGRTHLQHALPITFGYKAALWLDPLPRHRARIAALRPRIGVGAFAGAAGTLASLGKDGLAVQEKMMAELGLAMPPISWHVVRDNVAEAVAILGLVTASLAKIATDVMLMMQNELGEAFEPYAPGRGASSTMPQKRNPIASEMILAAAKVVRQLVPAMLDAQVQDHERATGPWHVEWVVLPQAFLLTAAALRHTRSLAEGLEVDAARMRRNLDLTGGLIVSEAVMMALAPMLGRQVAHDLVYDHCRQALAEGKPLAPILAADPAITKHLSRERIERLCDPANYVGLAPAMVDRRLAEKG
jgi:3-carboxy-cis,cis-muconate cycloisomerase